MRAAGEAEGLVSTVVTFDRHPLSLFAPEKCPVALVSNRQKVELLADAGVDATLMLRFDRELAAVSAEDFVRGSSSTPSTRRVVFAGSDFRFGAKAAGDVALLRTLGAELGFEVRMIDDVRADGDERRTSSTWVRELLTEGRVREAAAVLGRLPSIRSTVVHGDARGRDLGFPTANLAPELEGFRPADGVYATWAVVDGVRYPAATSIGNNPTFEGVPEHRVEAYLIDQRARPLRQGDRARVRRLRPSDAAFRLGRCARRATRRRRHEDPGHPRRLSSPLNRPPRIGSCRLLARVRSGRAAPWRLLGIMLVSLSLRTAVAALSPIVDHITGEVPFDNLALAIVGSAPPIAFAVAGLLTPLLARRVGLERALLIAVGRMIVGHLGRALAPSSTLLVVATVVTLLGVGVGNVLLPPVVKRYFPDRVGLVTAIYATILSVSTAVPALVAVPIADAAGWRVSLGVWFVVAATAAIPWIPLALRARRPSREADGPPAIADAGHNAVETGAIDLADAEAAGTEAAVGHARATPRAGPAAGRLDCSAPAPPGR